MTMACACGKSSYNGRCGCQSNYDGMKNHLTDQQIRDVRRKFDDKLFAQAYYADEESYSALFGNLFKKKNKEASPSASAEAPKKKINLGNIAEKGLGLLKKVGGLIKGEQPVYSGDYEGMKYETNLNPERETSSNNADNKKPEEKKGIPKPVIYTGIAVIVIILLFVIVKVMSGSRPVATVPIPAS